MTERTNRSRRQTTIVVVLLLLVACGPAVPTAPPPSVRLIPTTSPAPESVARTSPPAGLGGYDWMPVDARQFAGVGLTAVTSATGGGLFGIGELLMAEAPDGTPRHPTAWVSPDGREWTRLPDSQAFVSPRAGWEETVFDIAPDGQGFVAVGVEEQVDGSNANAAAWLSPDGRRWTRGRVADGTGRTMDQVVATDHGFVAIGEAGYDFHAGFGAGTAIWTSSDGLSWTRLPDTSAPPRGTALRAIVASTSGYLATASFEHSQGDETTPRQPVTAGIWRSEDAVHWEAIRGSPLGVSQIAREQDGFVAIGSLQAGGRATAVSWRSSDGRAWTRVDLPVANGLPSGTSIYGQRLVAGSAGHLAFGERDDDFSAVGWSSRDGTAWTPLDLTANLDGARIDKVAAVGRSILLVGDRSTAAGQEPVMWLLAP